MVLVIGDQKRRPRAVAQDGTKKERLCCFVGGAAKGQSVLCRKGIGEVAMRL